MVWTLDDTRVLDIPNVPCTWENSGAIKMRSEALAESLGLQFSIDRIGISTGFGYELDLTAFLQSLNPQKFKLFGLRTGLRQACDHANITKLFGTFEDRWSAVVKIAENRAGPFLHGVIQPSDI